MISVKMVLIKDHGVLGFIMNETPYGATVRWYVDGLSYTSFLEKGEYIEKFTGEINA